MRLANGHHGQVNHCWTAVTQQWIRTSGMSWSSVYLNRTVGTNVLYWMGRIHMFPLQMFLLRHWDWVHEVAKAGQ
jgi:hypothetical protein